MGTKSGTQRSVTVSSNRSLVDASKHDILETMSKHCGTLMAKAERGDLKFSDHFDMLVNQIKAVDLFWDEIDTDEKTVIAFEMGMFDGQSKTDAETAEATGLTLQDVKRIETSAMNKIYKAQKESEADMDAYYKERAEEEWRHIEKNSTTTQVLFESKIVERGSLVLDEKDQKIVDLAVEHGFQYKKYRPKEYNAMSRDMNERYHIVMAERVKGAINFLNQKVASPGWQYLINDSGDFEYRQTDIGRMDEYTDSDRMDELMTMDDYTVSGRTR